ncbi:MAG: 5-formyltetrahydrofolate cyclo-ligase [Silicimonas sp.]|nr:5-formyltetrahydrofolate cyclo-ligase [Silicimonas sp.]
MSAAKSVLRKDMATHRAKAHATVDPAPALATLIDTLRPLQGPISFYWPIRTEIDPRPAMRALASTHAVCLPVTQGYDALIFRTWTEDAPMHTDGFGVQTPDASMPEVTPQTLVIPMLAFDAACHRLGYGAGHYDRTLEKLREKSTVTTIGFAYAAQRLKQALPTDPTDQSLDMIITERGLQTPHSSW